MVSCNLWMTFCFVCLEDYYWKGFNVKVLLARRLGDEGNVQGNLGIFNNFWCPFGDSWSIYVYYVCECMWDFLNFFGTTAGLYAWYTYWKGFFGTSGCMEGYDTNQRGTKRGPNGEQKYNLYLQVLRKMLSLTTPPCFPPCVLCINLLCLSSFCA